MNNINTIYIDESFLYDEFFTSGVGLSQDSFKKAYEIWEEANNTIIKSENNFELLNQGYTSLKRAFNEASLVLKKELAIHNLKYDGNKKRDFFKTIEDFNIIRSNAIKNYITFRNNIEHNSGNPPEKDLCILHSEYILAYIKILETTLSRITNGLYYKDKQYGLINFLYTVEQENFGDRYDHFPRLKVVGYLDYRKVSYVKNDFKIVINNAKLINNASEYIRDEEDFYRESFDSNCLKILFQGEITDHNIIKKFVENVVLSEAGGGYEEINISKVFY